MLGNLIEALGKDFLFMISVLIMISRTETSNPVRACSFINTFDHISLIL